MRATTTHEDREFSSAFDFGNLLEQAAEYIAENFPPEDVYTVNQLRDWALDNGFVEKDEE